MATTTSPKTSGLKGALDRYFQITERGSSISREIRGGLVTFLAMCYILALNPLILGGPDGTGALLGGDNSTQRIAAATALAAGVLTILMGVVARFPLAIATGLGLNALVAFGVADGRRGPQALQVSLLEPVASVTRSQRKPADDMAVIVEDLIKVLDKVGNDLRRGRYPERAAGQKYAALLRAVAADLEA